MLIVFALSKDLPMGVSPGCYEQLIDWPFPYLAGLVLEEFIVMLLRRSSTGERFRPSFARCSDPPVRTVHSRKPSVAISPEFSLCRHDTHEYATQTPVIFSCRAPALNRFRGGF